MRRQCDARHVVYSKLNRNIDLHVSQQLSAISQIETVLVAGVIAQYVDHIRTDQSVPGWQRSGDPFFPGD